MTEEDESGLVEVSSRDVGSVPGDCLHGADISDITSSRLGNAGGEDVVHGADSDRRGRSG